MIKRTLSALLCWGITANSMIAATPPPPPIGKDKPEETQQHWDCHTASDASMRKQQVERNLLPRVAFVGETKPANVETRMAEHKAPALSVAVIRNGALDWSAAWGRLKADGARAGCDSLFQAGSLAKPATVLATLRMQQQGLVDLDADIVERATECFNTAARRPPAFPGKPGLV